MIVPLHRKTASGSADDPFGVGGQARKRMQDQVESMTHEKKLSDCPSSGREPYVWHAVGPEDLPGVHAPILHPPHRNTSVVDHAMMFDLAGQDHAEGPVFGRHRKGS